MARTGNKVTRRGMLKGSAAVMAGLTVVPRHVLGGRGYTAPSDTIQHAVIGVGGMGRGHVNMVNADAAGKLMAVCDVDEKHLANAIKQGRGCKGYKDYREVFDRGDIDVAHVVTPPHWHALISIAAAEAGIDVWCEKPMTRTIAEGQHVIDAVQRNGVVFRLNTWFRLYGGLYGFGSPAKPVKKLVESGELGWPLTARVSPHTGFSWKVRMWSGKTNVAPEPVPAGLDYDRWLGPAPLKPYFRHRTHGSFRGYWDYDGGGLADMGQHYLDPVQYILGKDDTSPVEIEAHAPWPTHPDACGAWGRVVMTYADGCRIILESAEWGKQETKGKPYIEGPKGKLYRGFKTDPPELAEKVKSMPDPEPMISDFNISVRTRRKFGLNEVNGNRSNLLVHLANVAIRTGRKLKFDPVKQRFINDEGANRLADQPMRAPWHL
ncbi:MAG: Gfo/Idh/MocA family oxidoreductase [Phycisphaerae bacterium]|nr:Gfo/Idh/MocA family oxidoreductase [Phycisphaerae bacterium]